MEMELGKLFIGGISWDTNEDSLRNYFQAFGEVVEVVIMKDRATGRARGFGFVVFADPYVAERVVMKKHLIDGRNVEAKKAVPREDQNLMNRNTSSNMHGSLGQARTKKIFVGGLASTVTESDFKKYFEQFGTITDVIVMYDHNTQRPRGFGFITYDSEEAVERVLQKTFHELNGKMVEVKWAVPKELSLVQPRSPLTGYNFSPSRVSSLLHGYNQGLSSNLTGGLGSRMDGRFSPVTVGQSTFSPFGPGFAINFDQGLSSNYGGNSNFGSNLGYGRLSPSYNGNLSKYESAIGYGEGNGGDSSLFNATARTLWENRSMNNAPISTKSDTFMGTGTGNSGVSFFGGIGGNWGSSANSGQGGGNGSAYNNRHFSQRSGDLGVNLGGLGFERYSGVTDVPISSLAASNDGNGTGPYRDIFENRSLFGDSNWLSSSLELEGSGSLGFGLGNAASDVASKNSAGYTGGYSVANRQANRGIAA